MLFSLFLIFQIVSFISCSISCYNAPFDINSFDYIVTPDHFPSELKNSSLVANSTSCYLQVVWQRDPDNTKIALIAVGDQESVPSEHQLSASVGYQRKKTRAVWLKSIIYLCQTDQCNGLSQLKRLLTALTVNESLSQLTYLLNPVKPFHGDWCYRGSNVTTEQCNTSIPIDLCKRCDLIETMDQNGLQVCGKCSTEDSENDVLLYQKTFNMIDRTDTSEWGILCARQNCNRPMIGTMIRQYTSISFNYANLFER